MFFFVLSCGGFAPRKKSLLIFAKHDLSLYILKLYIVIYLFKFIYIYTYTYMYIYIYICIYVYIYMCVCVRVCVCVGGLSQNEVSFFPLKEPFLEPKKDRHIHVYTINIYMYIDRCFFCPVLVCPIQNICFLVFFCM